MISPSATLQKKLVSLQNRAEIAARSAADAVMPLYGRVQQQDKPDASPVTEADYASEKAILQVLQGTLPDELNLPWPFPILSEESADDLKRLSEDWLWIVDPLDGTKDFLQQTNEFSVMIGLAYQGRPVVGVVINPATGELFTAAQGQGAERKSKDGSRKKLWVTSQKDFKQFRLLVSRNHLLEKEQRVRDQLEITQEIPCGSAGYKSAIIADGRAELYLNTSDKTWEWDICAADVIVREAGGLVTDMFGQDLVYNREDSRNRDGFVVSNGFQHEAIIGTSENIKL